MSCEHPDTCPYCGQDLPSESRRRMWSEAEDFRLVDLLNSGCKSREIAVELGRAVTSIRSRMLKLGLTTPAEHGVRPAMPEEAPPTFVEAVCRPGVRVITHRIRG
jgi:hypothetical protein